MASIATKEGFATESSEASHSTIQSKPNMKTRPIRLAVAAASLLASVSAHAAITYVDASASNLTLADGSAFTPNLAANVYNDNNWSFRQGEGLASSNTVYEAGASPNDPLTGETVPIIRQTITGLEPGIYNVYAYFWMATNVRWGLSAGLSPEGMEAVHGIGTDRGVPGNITFSNPNATRVFPDDLTDTDLFAVAPTLANGGGDRVLGQFFLGVAEVDGSGTLSAYIGNQPAVNAGVSPSLTNSRTWFDGVGYQVIPEPSSALLGLLGATALLRRRR